MHVEESKNDWHFKSVTEWFPFINRQLPQVFLKMHNLSVVNVSLFQIPFKNVHAWYYCMSVLE